MKIGQRFLDAILNKNCYELKKLYDEYGPWLREKIPINVQTLESIFNDKKIRKNMMGLLIKCGWDPYYMKYHSYESALNIFLRFVTKYDKDAAEIATTLLNHGKSIEEADREGYLPLHQAILTENKKLITALLKRGANIRAKTTDAFGHPVLNVAAATNDASVLRLLLSSGAEIFSKSNHGMTPLHVACHRSCDKIITPLLFSGVKFSDNSVGVTSLAFLFKNRDFGHTFKTMLAQFVKLCHQRIPIAKSDVSLIEAEEVAVSYCRLYNREL